MISIFFTVVLSAKATSPVIPCARKDDFNVQNMLKFLLHILFIVKATPLRSRNWWHEGDKMSLNRLCPQKPAWIHGLACAITVQMHDISSSNVCEASNIINFMPVLLAHRQQNSLKAVVANVHLEVLGQNCQHEKCSLMGLI